MASPKVVGFLLLSGVDGTPLTGQTPTFATYCDDSAVDITPLPTITEVKGGLYVFAPTFRANRALLYVIDAGSNSYSRYYTEVLRPESFDVDQIATAASQATNAASSADLAAVASEMVRKFQTNRWKVVSNQLVIFDDNGTTPYKSFNLLDQSSAPTMTNIFERFPV